MIKRLAQKFAASVYLIRGLGKPSYSQAGEDRILHYFFDSQGIAKPSYLDIGTNEPVLGSNTFFFYTRGAKGVCIEPNPHLLKKIKSVRPKDLVLNIGIGLNDTARADYYVFDDVHSGWNTFSKEDADHKATTGHAYKEVLQIELKNVNQIIENNFPTPPDFISIDVEGLDMEIIRSLDFDRFGPRALVVETIRFGDTARAEKQHDLIDYIKARGYAVYADTFINTIFVKNSLL